MGQLVLKNMEFYAHHGHFKEEQVIGGRFSVDIIIDTDITRASESDDLGDAIDYSLIYEAVRTEMSKPSKLLEHIAKRILDVVYTVSGNSGKVTVTVSKLNPPVGGRMEKFSVILAR